MTWLPYRVAAVIKAISEKPSPPFVDWSDEIEKAMAADREETRRAAIEECAKVAGAVRDSTPEEIERRIRNLAKSQAD